MIIIKSSQFEKDYRKLSISNRRKVEIALTKFAIDPFDRSLNNHALCGLLKGSFAIKVGHDLRIIYRKEKGFVIVTVVAVGKHEDVY